MITFYIFLYIFLFTDTSDVTRRSKMNRYPSSQGALTIGRTQNDQIQYQEQGGQQDFSGQGYYDWLIQQHNEMNQMAPPTLQSGEMNIPTGSSRSNPEAKGKSILDILHILNSSQKFLNIPRYSKKFRIITK